MVIQIWVKIGSGSELLPDGPKPLPEQMLTQSIKKFISASLLFNRFIKDVRIGLLQVNMIYEGQ